MSKFLLLFLRQWQRKIFFSFVFQYNECIRRKNKTKQNNHKSNSLSLLLTYCKTRCFARSKSIVEPCCRSKSRYFFTRCFIFFGGIFNERTRSKIDLVKEKI